MGALRPLCPTFDKHMHVHINIVIVIAITAVCSRRSIDGDWRGAAHLGDCHAHPEDEEGKEPEKREKGKGRPLVTCAFCVCLNS